MTRRTKAIILGIVTSVVGYLMPILGWGVLPGKLGELAFTIGMAIDAPGSLAAKILDSQRCALGLLFPIVINGMVYAFPWMGIFLLLGAKPKPREQDSVE